MGRIVEFNATVCIAPSGATVVKRNLQRLESLGFDVHKLTEREKELIGIGIWGGAGYVDTQEQALLNGFIQDPSYSGFATLWCGLSSTTPTEAGGNITEPSGSGYARVSTTAADFGAATGTAPATKSNSAAKAFAQASGTWLSGVNITNFLLMDASSAGNLAAFGAMGTPKPVTNGDTPSLPIGAIVFKLGDPGDSF